MINFDDVVKENIKVINFNDAIKENIKEYNPNWLQIPDHPYRILIGEGSGYEKANLLFNLINQQPDVDKIYLYPKDPYEAKDQFLIKNVKMLEQTILVILKLLLNNQMLWMIFIKTLKNTTQVKT